MPITQATRDQAEALEAAAAQAEDFAWIKRAPAKRGITSKLHEVFAARALARAIVEPAFLEALELRAAQEGNAGELEKIAAAARLSLA